MKRITSTDKPREFETQAIYKGRPLVITIGSLGVRVREKRRRDEVFVPYSVIYEVGWRMEARQQKGGK